MAIDKVKLEDASIAETVDLVESQVEENDQSGSEDDNTASGDGKSSDVEGQDTEPEQAQEEEEEVTKETKAPKKKAKARKDAKVVANVVNMAKVTFTWEAGKPLAILAILSSFFKSVIQLTPDNLLQAVYLCINRICPEYEGLELGIGESILMKAIAEATGRTVAKIKADMVTVGDLGAVAQASRGTQSTMFKPKVLDVPSVFKTLKEIAKVAGGSSQKVKVDKIKGLLVACRNSEAKYLVRSLEGKLRIGLAGQTVLVALAHACVLAKCKKLPSSHTLEVEMPKAVESVKAVFSEIPSYDLIVPALLAHPIDELPNICHLTPGVPLKPMLAHPTKSIGEVLDRFDGRTFTCEYKYDGERAQIHRLEDGSAFVYSRNSENLSAKYPDILDRLPKIFNPDVQSFVLDCEAVAWDKEKGIIMPFQVLSTRKRKDVQAENIAVQVCVYAFDILYLNGKSLLRETFEKRRELLYGAFKAVPGEFMFAKAMNTSSMDDIQTFLDQSIVDHCEGLMVKSLQEGSSYEPSRRTRNWLKVKKDYLEGAGDSLDLVVIGGYIGKGKRTGVYGGYLLACYNPDTEEYESICKIGTGFSEEDLTQQATALKDLIISAPKSYYKLGDAKADVYFDCKQVWEVKAADLSVSPVYKAAVGLVDPTKGISLRFPRFLRIRDDKGPEDATTSSQVCDMYRNQQIIKSADKASGNQLDDEY
ncbi:ATP-dependent DNA ligase Cdc17 [Sorochytrium milnesiophthora]